MKLSSSEPDSNHWSVHPVKTPRQRLKFEEVLHTAAADGHCRIGVRMEWCGRMLQASAEGVETPTGRVRAAVSAALQAAMEVSEGRVTLKLVGVKAFRAFDGWVVVARLNGEAEGRSYRLLGSASCEDDEALERTSVYALLNATNRVLARYVRAE